MQPIQGDPGQQSISTAGQTFPRSKPLSLPPLFASKKHLTSSVYRETQLGGGAAAQGAEEELRVWDSRQRAPQGMLFNQRRLLEQESRAGWWCSAGESCYSAQWVKQKQEHRSTRPW
ncbi:hypothetical protein PBY51_004749 [Eleginops maclovinus]|uniref:Uncharacterized protein n=2 Tax=Eleginops maclovinus TaxID=56733 RepID=A0AAN8AFZ2_ELEMC|nr:hypothetical protein PBY51_004749 [Eleginops maclovinus]